MYYQFLRRSVGATFFSLATGSSSGAYFSQNFLTALRWLYFSTALPSLSWSLKNTKLVAKCGSKIVFEDFGEMLFTHFGVSGPIVLSCSSKINRLDNVDLIIDLKPALDEETLNKRMLRELSENKGKAISTIMRSLLPKALIPCVLKQAGINSDINASELKTQFRKNIVYALKNLKFKVKKLRPIEEAIVTAGGVNVREINPKTMESKIISNLYFAGEVIDVDAFTGGYNLQLAFSTGYVAGANC